MSEIKPWPCKECGEEPLISLLAISIYLESRVIVCEFCKYSIYVGVVQHKDSSLKNLIKLWNEKYGKKEIRKKN